MPEYARRETPDRPLEPATRSLLHDQEIGLLALRHVDDHLLRLSGHRHVAVGDARIERDELPELALGIALEHLNRLVEHPLAARVLQRQHVKEHPRGRVVRREARGERQTGLHLACEVGGEDEVPSVIPCRRAYRWSVLASGSPDTSNAPSVTSTVPFSMANVVSSEFRVAFVEHITAGVVSGGKSRRNGAGAP